MSSAEQPLAATRHRVTDELRERIVGGELKPGDRLVERELAEAFGVSRVPVREAIRSLESEGFVVVTSPRRVIVRQLDRTDVEELFDVREALEGLAAGLAATRASRDDLKRLKKLLSDAARATESGRASRIARFNTRFHDEIVAIAGNGLLTTVLDPLAGRLRWLTRQNEHWHDLVSEHEHLYEAIASGDRERAANCGASHVRVNREVTLRALFPDEF